MCLKNILNFLTTRTDPGTMIDIFCKMFQLSITKILHLPFSLNSLKRVTDERKRKHIKTAAVELTVRESGALVHSWFLARRRQLGREIRALVDEGDTTHRKLCADEMTNYEYFMLIRIILHLSCRPSKRIHARLLNKLNLFAVVSNNL